MMRQTLKMISYGLIALLAFVGGVFFDRRAGTHETVRINIDTVTVVRVDTIRVVEPKPVTIAEYKTDTIIIYHESEPVYIPIPLKKYTFAGPEYKVEASGYKVELQAIEVYPTTIVQTITNEKILTKRDTKRLGIGIQAGYGITRNGVSPYVGVGVHYSVIRF